MFSTNREQQTIDYYDKNAQEWASTHNGYADESYWKAEMAKFHDLLPSGKVLEIGSGTGKDAADLLNMYDYVGTDASEGLLKIAHARNPQAEFRHISVYDLDFPKNSFDGFWTAATLLHVPQERIDEVLQKIKTQVKTGGVGFISVKAGAGERVDHDTGRWFAYYSQKGFHQVLERNEFKVLEEKTKQGQKDWWLCYWVRV